MKICIVCDDIFPSLGGKGKVAERYSKKLAERGHDIIILAGRYKNKKGLCKKGKIKIYRFLGIALPKNNRKFFLGMPSPYQLYRILKDRRIDIINTYSWTYLTFMSILVGKSMGIPVLMSAHSQPKNLTSNIGIEEPLIEKYFYKFIVWVCNMSDAVQVPSRFSYRMLVKNGFRKKAEIISNGVDLKFFTPNVDHSTFVKRFNLENKRIVLYVGRLMKEKNVETLIKNFCMVSKKIKDSCLVIVGDGFLKAELQKLAYSLGLTDKVIFVGNVDERHINIYFAAADLFVLPSLAETQGLVILEAMASRKPLLVARSRDSAAAELIVKGKNGYTFDPRDEHDLSSKMIKLLENKNLRLRMGKHSLSYAKNHNINKSVDKMESLYRSLLKE